MALDTALRLTTGAGLFAIGRERGNEAEGGAGTGEGAGTMGVAASGAALAESMRGGAGTAGIAASGAAIEESMRSGAGTTGIAAGGAALAESSADRCLAALVGPRVGVDAKGFRDGVDPKRFLDGMNPMGLSSGRFSVWYRNDDKSCPIRPSAPGDNVRLIGKAAPWKHARGPGAGVRGGKAYGLGDWWRGTTGRVGWRRGRMRLMSGDELPDSALSFQAWVLDEAEDEVGGVEGGP